MGYEPLGSIRVESAADTSGANPGNWTTQIDVSAVGHVPVVELYHAVVENVLPGASAKIQVNVKSYSFTQPVSGAEWDPVSPMLLRQGDQVFFLWDTPTTQGAYRPVVTAWFRYDPLIPANRS